MQPPEKTRHFSLRSFFVWMLLLSLSFALIGRARDADSPFLVICGIGCLFCLAVAGLLTLQRCWKYTMLVVLSLPCIYAGVYVGLSMAGRYEPVLRGPSGVRRYDWAPAGFVRDYNWDRRMMLAFAPLYYVDSELWHHCVGGDYRGPYPINPD